MYSLAWIAASRSTVMIGGVRFSPTRGNGHTSCRRHALRRRDRSPSPKPGRRSVLSVQLRAAGSVPCTENIRKISKTDHIRWLSTTRPLSKLHSVSNTSTGQFRQKRSTLEARPTPGVSVGLSRSATRCGGFADAPTALRVALGRLPLARSLFRFRITPVLITKQQENWSNER